jgi:hypothetical protein
MSGFMDIDRQDALTMVGKGWASLINELYDNKPEDVRVLQVKEKFGTLRFYVSSAQEDYLALIDNCQTRSAIICEECGAEGRLRDGVWMVTLCDECATRHQPKVEDTSWDGGDGDHCHDDRIL